MSDKDTIIHISESEDLNYLVSVLVLITKKINIDTLNGMAASEGKTRRGIKVSKRYTKLDIGRAKLAVKGLEDNNLPI